ncbi:epithelial cell-transforming sequence 2 oncogene-like [Rhinatrema bivittatum]|uniref:epithelial cell-transforming sequence 2 oncogene-like n=1 Tax=Rhinatrema bivittatum TaxID=194408 RepID=UPI00112704E9|nr:epithelial cell-transforming sequence 2 oncogene-like [Rhinatrema bivittatum]
MAASMRGSPHSVKQWQLASVGLPAGETAMCITEPTSRNLSSMSNQTRFSAWTPLANKSFNKELFHERVCLICHWFDLWTDKQRNQLFQALLVRSGRSQLKFVQDWFTEEVPVTKLDFTTVLPRFISLYVFSFLSPQELSAAAQVNWHWKFLSEQDCLWMPKCIKFGWFLPYTPSDNEYGAWKRHYIACVAHLDYLTPREATEIYGTLNEPKEGDEEQEEKWREKWLRKTLRERLAQHKRELFKTRPPWVTGTWNSTLLKSKSQPRLSQAVSYKTAVQAALWLIRGKTGAPNMTLSRQLAEESKPISSISLTEEKQLVSSSIKTLSKRKYASGSNLYPVLPSRQFMLQPQETLHLLLISSRIPAYEMVLDSIKPNVVPLVYDHSGMTLEGLHYYIEKVLDGRTAKTIGIVANGDSREIDLVQGSRISIKNVLSPEVRDFWEKMGSCVAAAEEDGKIYLFVPLAASESGMKILSQLSQLTGVSFSTPTGTATGSYQHILSEWLGGQEEPPPALYFNAVKIQAWCGLAEVLEEALRAVRKQMRPYLGELQENVCGRTVGQFMFDSMSIAKILTNRETAQAIAEGLMKLSRENCENPLEFLALFLLRKCRRNMEFKPKMLTECNSEASLSTILEQEDAEEKEISTKEATCHLHETEQIFDELLNLDSSFQGDSLDKRTSFAREIMLSEKTYVQMLDIVRVVYAVPLKAALASNRAILSFTNVQIIFSDVLSILELNRRFLGELAERLQEWGPAQCLGDVFTKLGMQLKTYTNFFNNYAVILKTIDKCRETMPSFRAFLKRHDKTVVTKMMTLQELLLCPSARFEEYVYLLYALRLHTPSEHADREDLSAAVKQMKQYRDYIKQLKQKLDKDDEMLNTQKIIQGCPSLLEANRHLIRVQDVALLSCCDKEIRASLRMYEHVSDLSLFLFNDALVLARRSVSSVPFLHTCSTRHHFLASVALHRLLLEDISDSKYVKNAFILQGPKRCWICSTETEDDKFTWLSALQSAIGASIDK